MNGLLVGEWSTSRTGNPIFRYADSWVDSRQVRALSLSLPITADRTVRGDVVDYYFDNLLPESIDIRRRLRERFATRTTQAFDLLEAIGRDCVGAVQLLPMDHEPEGWDRVEATKLSESALEQLLRAVKATPPLGAHDDDDDFRISLTGAQEKTALLSMGGQWFRPHGATPTTHILKLPLGIVGNFRGDFSDSVQNEWLCGQLLREFGLPIAETKILHVGALTVLAVKRFDRRWQGTDETAVARRGFKPKPGIWIARLPQEDLCQATGRPWTQKYEADGGPSIEEILSILAAGENSATDREHFVLAQLAFWLLAAIDGHAKNFSLYQRVGGSFGMTPLYDVLSAWPVIGAGPNKLQFQDAKLAMAIAGTSRHYRLREIQPRHWQALAQRIGIPGLWDGMQNLVQSANTHVERVGLRLPAAFPERVYASIADGVRRQAASFLEAET